MAFPELYVPNGVDKVYWFGSAVTIATPASGPTRSQITAATELGAYDLSSISGFDEAAQYTDFPLIRSRSAAKVFTGSNLNNGELIFGADKNGRSANNDIRTLATFKAGMSGHMLWCDGGDVTASLAYLYQVGIDTITPVRGAGSVKTLRVAMSIFAIYPDIALPATV